jgi:hypothetical protein
MPTAGIDSIISLYALPLDQLATARGVPGEISDDKRLDERTTAHNG